MRDHDYYRLNGSGDVNRLLTEVGRFKQAADRVESTNELWPDNAAGRAAERAELNRLYNCVSYDVTGEISVSQLPEPYGDAPREIALPAVSTDWLGPAGVLTPFMDSDIGRDIGICFQQSVVLIVLFVGGSMMAGAFRFDPADWHGSQEPDFANMLLAVITGFLSILLAMKAPGIVNPKGQNMFSAGLRRGGWRSRSG